jgi:hypothetical protein
MREELLLLLARYYLLTISLDIHICLLRTRMEERTSAVAPVIQRHPTGVISTDEAARWPQRHFVYLRALHG